MGAAASHREESLQRSVAHQGAAGGEYIFLREIVLEKLAVQSL